MPHRGGWHTRCISVGGVVRLETHDALDARPCSAHPALEWLTPYAALEFEGGFGDGAHHGAHDHASFRGDGPDITTRMLLVDGVTGVQLTLGAFTAAAALHAGENLYAWAEDGDLPSGVTQTRSGGVAHFKGSIRVGPRW